MSNIEELQRIHNKVHNNFIYEYDEKNYGVLEDWRSKASLVNENKKFVDDCDGFAMTMCELMIEAGFDPGTVSFIVCETETGEGHAVAGYTDNQTTWIAENRYYNIYDWNDKPKYKWFYYMKFDRPGQWFKVNNDY
jgi:predicted transglutaminase-like cysteine proteinase